MNAAQLTGLRKTAETMHATPETMTAREMALTPHSLSQGGTIATVPHGGRWAWDEFRGMWVRYDV